MSPSTPRPAAITVPPCHAAVPATPTPSFYKVEENQWRDLLLERFGPLLEANQVQFQLDVLTDFGADPLQGVAGAVVATAEHLDAAALVVYGHSKGTLAEWLLGSVSDYAVHHSSVPVVVLHGPEYDTSTTN